MRENSGNKSGRPSRTETGEKKGLGLPPTTSKPPMPPVNPPKEDE